MGSRTSELILKATDQWTDTLKKTQAQFAATKIAADDLNRSVQKLEKLHPGLNQDEARAAAEALNRMRDASEASGRGFANASLAARGLGQEIGVTLPRAVTAFLAQSKLIGPVLSGAFGVVAVVGLAEALSQIPAAYDKIVGAITGLDTKAREAYDHFREENRKAFDDLVKFQAKMAEIQNGPGAGNAVSLQAAQGQLTSLAVRETTLRNAATALRTGPIYQRQPDGTDTLAPTTFEGMSPSELEAEADRINKLRIEGAKQVIDLQRQGIMIDTEGAKKAAEDRIEIQKQYADFFSKQLEDFRNKTFGEANLPGADAVKQLQAATHESVQAMVKDWKDLQEEQTSYQKFFDKQLEDFRIKAPGSSADIEAGVKVGDESAKKIIKGYEEAQKQQKEFIKTFQEGIGHAWDDFRQKGFGAFADLANYVAKKFTEGILTRLLFGGGAGTQGIAASLGGIGVGGGSGGGLLGGLIGKLGINSGPWSEAIPGKGGGSLLGGLFGGGSSLTALTGSSGLQGIGALLGIQSFSGTGLGLTGGGVTGALGLGGGSGLLGLGAATIPVIGGLAAAAALIAFEIFGHHKEAPFTRDPNEIQKTREYLFYAGAAALSDAAKNIADFSHNMNTLPAGTLVKNGLPVALNSSNQFRRQVNSVLQQDL